MHAGSHVCIVDIKMFEMISTVIHTYIYQTKSTISGGSSGCPKIILRVITKDHAVACFVYLDVISMVALAITINGRLVMFIQFSTALETT